MCKGGNNSAKDRTLFIVIYLFNQLHDLKSMFPQNVLTSDVYI